MTYRYAIIAWLALLLMFGGSLLAAITLAGPLRYLLCFLLATAMAACIMISFMGLRAADGMLRIFAAGGVLWLAFLLLLTILEVITR